MQRALRTASTADDLFQAALESEQIGATAEAEGAYRNAHRSRSRRTSPRTSTSAACGTSAERSTKRSGCTGARSSSSPTIPTARFNLGVVLEDRGATTEAIEQYREAARLDPRVADVHFNLARLYQQTGDQQAALRHFSRFRALTRDRAD